MKSTIYETKPNILLNLKPILYNSIKLLDITKSDVECFLKSLFWPQVTLANMVEQTS